MKQNLVFLLGKSPLLKNISAVVYFNKPQYLVKSHTLIANKV